MRGSWALVLFGCGRIGFAPTGGDTAPPPRVEQLPCNTRVLLDPGGDREQDGLTWVSDGTDDGLLAILHNSDSDHPIERYAIEVGASGLGARDTGSIRQTVHSHYLANAPTSAGHVLSYYDVGAGVSETVELGPGLVVLGTQSLGALSDGDPAIARAGGGGLAVVGVRLGQIVVEGLGDDGAPTGARTVLATAATGPDFPTAAALDDGLAVVWHEGAACRLATVHADLSLAAGPVSMDAGSCNQPQVAWASGSRRIVVATDDSGTGKVIAAVWDPALAPVVAPFAVTPAGYGTKIVDDTDGAWVAWVRPSDAALQYVRVAADGSVTPGAALGHVDTALTHYHVLQRVAGSSIALWGDVDLNISLAAARLCR